MGGGGQLVVVLLGGGLGGALMESCTWKVLAEVPFGVVLDGVLDFAPDCVLDRVSTLAKSCWVSR